MSSLFPFINPPDDIVVEDDMPLPLYKEVDWDFDNDIPVIENGDFKIVEGDEAIKVWCYKSIKTNRYEHSIYSWDYGSETMALVGKGYAHDLTKAEAERYIKECLIINEYIKDVDIIDINFSDGLLSASVKVTTIYNEGGEVMELNV